MQSIIRTLQRLAAIFTSSSLCGQRKPGRPTDLTDHSTGLKTIRTTLSFQHDVDVCHPVDAMVHHDNHHDFDVANDFVVVESSVLTRP